ncbi:MAG: sugar porter family MFS transporter [Fibrobacterota bacterium]
MRNNHIAGEDQKPKTPFRVILIAAVAAIGGFLFGFDSGVINGAVEALQKSFGSGAAGSGFNVASMLLGCAAGAFIAGNVSDRFGRRTVLLVAALFFITSAWGSGVSSSSVEFIIFRLIGGLAVGAASIIAPAYISEIAPPAIRGRLASLQQMAIVLGLFCAFLSNFAIVGSAGGASAVFWWGFEAWQWMFWVELFPATLFFGALFLIPESPRYLVAAGKQKKAGAILGRLGHAVDEDAAVAEIERSLTHGRRPRITDIWDGASRRVHPIVWVGIGLAALQQLVGINVIFYYGAVLWKAAGFSEGNALLINVISGAVNIGSTLVAITLIDRIGRKPLLLFGSIGMAVFLSAVAILFETAGTQASGELSLSPGAGIAALLCANAYIFCFGVSWGPVMWVMLGEMFPNRFRGAALSVAGFIQWMANFTVTVTFPVLLAGLGLGGAYGFYALMALISVFFVYFLIRETKGKTFEEMG